MKTEIRLLKLTPEEIEKLPFPDTARKLGGIMMPFTVYESAEEEAIMKAKIEAMREQFDKGVTNVFRTPIFDV